MENGIDVFTKRPRIQNIQYTCLTPQQQQHIAKKSETLFALELPKTVPEKRWYKDRYVNSYSQHLVRAESGNSSNARYCWIDEQWLQQPRQKYNSCEPLASVKWGPLKCGIKSTGYFYGQPTDKFTTIDMYRRNPTNLEGPVFMDYGRPGEGYYTQKFPSESTWNMSSVPLNRTKILESVPQKTTAEYELLAATAKEQPLG